ncbi:hypothetical protein LTR66_012070, partial [Elasticomyces elasticus]
TSNTIKVVARFRPQNRIELASGGENVVDFDGEDTVRIQSEGSDQTFTFDRVFPPNSDQSSVFDFSIRSTVDDILNGYNGTVFAYGQTGAGKSYTMMGAGDRLSETSDPAAPDNRGIIPRIVEQIFASIMASESNIEYTVRVSYMEIYMERIRDLLAPANTNLPIHEEKSRGVYVKGLLEIYVSSLSEVYEVLHRGGMARMTASTNMNAESSRSHSIFVLTVAQKNLSTGSAKSGQLFLVDLAGSEKVGKTGASGQTLEEAKKINKSLSSLGNVINSLTDGKSSHIPYRDSKLTRILQESLGGNSRTTLIINCSPSNWNEAETVSTLRFGVRAKSIKNKARVNVELSPAELKQLLKKAQTQVQTFEAYVANLESEVGSWRNGESVPKEQWTPGLQDASAKVPPKPRPATPSRLHNRADTPSTSRPESRLEVDRASTPSLALEKDEREDFLRRENELQDQLADRESALAAAQQSLLDAKNEVRELRESHQATHKDNERLAGEVETLRMQTEKLAFEAREGGIMLDSLKEANAELTMELDEVKQSLLDARISVQDSSAVQDEKERLKRERMKEMMSGFDLGGEAPSDGERSVRELLERLDQMYEVAASGEAVAAEDLSRLRDEMTGLQGVVRDAKTRSASMTHDEPTDQAASGVKTTGDDLQASLSHHVEENARLRSELETLRKQTNGHVPATAHQSLTDFDNLKKSLMRDLQNRCERVVELEISLDSTRESYNTLLRNSNSRAQQKKLAFLERNLEQLVSVQRGLVEQNAQLKKECAIAERKLVARQERIQALEGLVGDSQERLLGANARFEAQLQAVKERLEAAKIGSTRGLSLSTSANTTNGFGPFGSRIAKPLRGGGGGGGSGGDIHGAESNHAIRGQGDNAHPIRSPLVPTFAGLQAQKEGDAANGGKRGSWFFNQRT